MRERDHHLIRAAEREERVSPPAPEAQGDGESASDDRTRDDASQRPTSDAAPDPPQATADDGTVSQATADQQLAELNDKFLRLAAEYDNFRKRSARERAESGSRAQAELITRLTDALDDLSRFAHIDPGTTDAQTLHRGIELVEQKMLKVLGAAGLEVINPLDQTFDPTLHEAVATEPALSPEDDHTVARVFQPGYRFNGQLLRPARVVVKQWQG